MTGVTGVPSCHFALARSLRGRGEVVRVTNGLGEEPIAARYLVERRYQQCVVVEIDADGERAFHSIDDHVEIVVGAERDLPRGTALGRFGIDVVELLEAGWSARIGDLSMPQ